MFNGATLPPEFRESSLHVQRIKCTGTCCLVYRGQKSHHGPQDGKNWGAMGLGLAGVHLKSVSVFNPRPNKNLPFITLQARLLSRQQGPSTVLPLRTLHLTPSHPFLYLYRNGLRRIERIGPQSPELLAHPGSSPELLITGDSHSSRW